MFCSDLMCMLEMSDCTSLHNATVACTHCIAQIQMCETTLWAQGRELGTSLALCESHKCSLHHQGRSSAAESPTGDSESQQFTPLVSCVARGT